MSIIAQQIAIAEACGFTETEPWLDGRRCFERSDSNAGWELDSIPDYLNDLNAMHEAEKVLTDEQDLEYSEALEQVVGARFGCNNAEDMRRLRSATAAQRAEAFLRTLGKWKDTQP